MRREVYAFRGTEQRTGSGEEKRDLDFRLESRGLKSRFYLFYFFGLSFDHFPVIDESCYAAIPNSHNVRICHQSTWS